MLAARMYCLSTTILFIIGMMQFPFAQAKCYAPKHNECARLYADYQCGGEHLKAYPGTPNNWVGWGFNDKASAVVVRAGCTLVMYEHGNGLGHSRTYGPHTTSRWLHLGGQWNDYVSSFKCECVTMLTSSSGQLKSPNYPGHYGHNEKSAFVISAPGGTKIVLSFMAFEIENNYDYLYIRDGNSASSNLLHKLTGGEHFADVVSSGNHLHITFTSDRSVAKPGFYISWEFQRSSPKNIVEQYAPKLRFDSKFGQSNKCFPSSAAYFYFTRKHGLNYRICITDYNRISSGDTPTYWRAMECGDDLHIAYWFFTGYQDTCSPGEGDHDSDWEHVVVKVVSYKLSSRKLGPVQFYQHKGWYTKNPGHYEVDGTHPIVYSGKNSHGSYHDDGGSGGCCYWEDYRNPGDSNKYMRTWLFLQELRRTHTAELFMQDLSSTDKFGMPSPLERPETYELCKLPGCKGTTFKTCHTSGCYKSHISSDDTF